MSSSLPGRQPAAAAAQATDEQPGSRRGWLLAVCCVAQFMVILDLSIVNVSLPSIQVSLRFSSADLQWVIDAYAIVFAGFLMLAGRVADLFGQRRTFVGALALFGLASLAGGSAPTSGVLIGARALQGLGGALMAASSLAIITSSFAAGPERHRAIGLWGAMNGAGGAAGVLLGGIITQELSWRWVLLINPPIAIAAALVARGVVSDHRAEKRPGFDLAGALVLTIGLLVEAYGGVTAGSDGWGSAAALVPIAVGTVLLTLFPLIEARAAAPLVPPGVFVGPLRIINAIVLLFSAALFPMWYVGSLYLQQVLALSPIATGLTFLPMALAIFACASQAGRLVGRAGVRPVLGGGLILMASGMALFARIGASGSAVQYVMLPGILTAIGIGFSIVPSTIAATQNAKPGQGGLASGLVNTSRQVGGGLGLAILISFATQHTTHLISTGKAVPQSLTDGFRISYLIAAGLAGLAALLTFTLVPNPAPPGRKPHAGRFVGIGVAGLLACFAAVAFGFPRSHGAPLGAYTARGAYTYVSAPGLHPPKIQSDAPAASAQIPGYIMLANFYDVTKPPIVGQSGPLILDGKMQPVWFRPVPADDVASNLDTGTYQGKPVLSWWQGNVTATGQINSGEDVVVNQHYQTVATLKGADGWVLTLHSFLIQGDDAWVTANKPVPADLAKYGGVNGGAVVDSAVQEYNLTTGKLLYSWNASDHIPVSDSYAQPPANGFPWDAYHVNSIDLHADGTFLVSMRNTSAAYEVDIATGRIQWTLGGRHSSFAIPPADHFEWQHDVELHGGSVVTMFDDHCCDITGAGQFLAATGPSRGLTLKLDLANHTVSSGVEFSHGATFESEYMGNVQTLPDGNVFVGWGEVPYFSEYTKSGKLLFDGIFPSPDITYRAYVQPWVGLPVAPPAGAARTDGGKTTVYASWNGATRLAAWKVLAGPGPDQLTTVATRATSGFETSVPIGQSAGDFKVEALDAAGRVIGTSKVFTPAG
ncbi:MAG TPA: MFS transporter [Solirubrobacteraceae bacterium]|jgi:EmrB/QacA subfamily drug resistance transporter|nr:MFS transporter [Solirubrobacteraceae bacterium]